MIPIKKVFRVRWTSGNLVRLADQSDTRREITLELSKAQAALLKEGEEVCLYLQRAKDLEAKVLERRRPR